MSTESMDNFHGLRGQFPWTLQTLTMNIVQSTRSNTPMEMSTEFMDFLQIGVAHIARHADIFKLFQEFSVYSIKFVQYMASLSF